MLDPGPIHTFSTQPRKRTGTKEEEMRTRSATRAVAAFLVTLGLILASCSDTPPVGTTSPRTSAPSTTSDDFQTSEPTEPSVVSEAPEDVVTAALAAWSDGDRPALDELLADDARWFGQSLTSEAGRRQFEFQWGFNTTLGATFAELECVDSGRKDTVSTGTLVECSGTFGDTRSELMGTNAAPFEAEYAVDGGRVVNAISFQVAMDEEGAAALDFIDAYLTGLDGDYGRACDPADSTGAGCAEFILSHLPAVVEAWIEEPAP